jgi:hypothetical protein
VSVEEPAATEEAKDNEAKKEADEDEQKETEGKKEDEAAEESNVEAMDTSVPDEIKKEEPADGKSNCCNACHVPFQIHVKACILIPVFYVRKLMYG